MNKAKRLEVVLEMKVADMQATAKIGRQTQEPILGSSSTIRIAEVKDLRAS